MNAPRNFGITGFTTVEQIRSLQETFLKCAKKYTTTHPTRFMIGILASSATLRDESPKFPGRYPKERDFPELFIAARTDHPSCPGSRSVFHPLMHFSIRSNIDLFQELELAYCATEGNCRGFQLNIAWPNAVALRRFKRSYSSTEFLLQLGSYALKQVEYNPDKLVEHLKPRLDTVSEVLLDPSGGNGKPFDPDLFAPLIDALMKLDGLGIGVAGGLSDRTVPKVKPLLQRCSYLSVDAESGLRNPNDELEIPIAERYLKTAFATLR